ncbi:hypothetical protein N658DRAFT_178240 [Parathielavia hyrcaniae]|uniref:Uncharacterized protein n=1 Tax=Parathielavia hyrcaniae TaxID=113614 RepID=A0AAN6T566_9PEZI|nr:hypothetical protein N658DRAFT_178240 [Parathielavia hyrcaniae]
MVSLPISHNETAVRSSSLPPTLHHMQGSQGGTSLLCIAKHPPLLQPAASGTSSRVLAAQWSGWHLTAPHSTSAAPIWAAKNLTQVCKDGPSSIRSTLHRPAFPWPRFTKAGRREGDLGAAYKSPRSPPSRPTELPSPSTVRSRLRIAYPRGRFAFALMHSPGDSSSVIPQRESETAPLALDSGSGR